MTGRRALRRRRQRVRWTAAGLAVLVAVLLVVTYVLARQPVVVPFGVAAPVGRTAHTELVVLQGPNGAAVAAAVLGDDEHGAAAGVVLPTSVQLPGSPMTVAAGLPRVAPPVYRAAVGDLVGVVVDGSWVLDMPTAARLVDRVGGVVVDGQRRAGTAAAAYAASGPAAWQAVLTGVLGALPQDVQGLLQGLGRRSVSSFATPRELAGRLQALHADPLRWGTLVVAGTSVDGPAQLAVAERLLGASVPSAARSRALRVLVLAGSQARARAQRDRLARLGIAVVGTGLVVTPVASVVAVGAAVPGAEPGRGGTSALADAVLAGP